ncbi:MAG: peroxiredoxin [Leptospirales bacterium]|nr:peroxiredoxin [Leptospirales bacterium]
MLQIGQRAPDFQVEALVNGQFKKIRLTDFRGSYVVLFFYPLDFTFVCPTEIIAFSDAEPEFKKRNAQVLGVSVDSVYSHLAWTNLPRNEGGIGKIAYPLLADITKSMAESYNVLLKDEGVALRGLFIIDPEGNLRVQVVHDNAIGRSTDEALRLLDALEFNREHGEVCPANWKKGDRTMKADPEKSRDFFRAAS